MSLFGALPELNYPIFLIAQKDMRKHPRVSAFFEFCVRELKAVLLRGTMGQVGPLIKKSWFCIVSYPSLGMPDPVLLLGTPRVRGWRSRSRQTAAQASKVKPVVGTDADEAAFFPHR